MANEKPPAAAPAEKPAGGDEKPPKKPFMKLAITGVAVLILEGATIGVTVKLASGPPRSAIANQPVAATMAAVEKDVEVKLVDAQMPNKSGGPLVMYALQVVAKVGEKNKGKVGELLTEREAEIRDHIRTIVASADHKSLEEPGLETLRRQIAYQLEQDVGKDLIKEILIPKCTWQRQE